MLYKYSGSHGRQNAGQPSVFHHHERYHYQENGFLTPLKPGQRCLFSCPRLGLVIVGDVDQLMGISKPFRRHLSSVFDHITLAHAICKPSPDTIVPRSPYLPPSLDVVDDATDNVEESQAPNNTEAKLDNIQRDADDLNKND